MATKADFQPLAVDVVEALGGPNNIATFTHCATRLRFKIKDSSKADLKKAEAVPGVLTAIAAGGQHQVVIGNDVPLAYAAMTGVPGMRGKGIKDDESEDGSGTDTGSEDTGPADKNFFNRFIDLISALFSPIIWALAGIAIGKAFLGMFAQFGWMDSASGTYLVFNAAFDGLFYFLPFFLALTAARRFKVNQFIAISVVAALLHPSIVELSATEGATAFGLPFPTMAYASSVIPAIIAVWLTGYVQRFAEKILPGALRNFLTPLISVTVMVPLVLFTIGPATTWLSELLSSGVAYLFDTAPWLAGAIMGGFWQVFVMFGLHWGFIPIFLNDLANTGQILIVAPLMAAVLAQGAATLAVFIVSKNVERKKVAGPAAISGLLAGITEPAIYGVNLPLKIPFYMGLAGGAVGGAIIAAGNNAANAFIFPSLLALPAFTEFGSFTAQLIGSGTAMAIAFVGTIAFARQAERRAEEDVVAVPPKDTDTGTEDTTPAAVPVAAGGATTSVLLPATGKIVPLEQIDDKVFASGVMGKGVGVVPDTGQIISPVSGTVVARPKSGHAFGIKTDDGVEVLVHVGIDTVKLKGEGFEPRVAKGDRVAAGDVLVDVDLEGVAKHGYDLTTILVITNTTKLTSVVPVVSEGTAQAGTVGLTVEV